MKQIINLSGENKSIKNIFFNKFFLLFFFLSPSVSYGANEALRIKIANGVYSDETVIRFVSGATSAFDGSYDAWKLFSPNASAPNIFTRSSEGYEVSINSQPEFAASFFADIYFKLNASGNYVFSSEEIGVFDPGVCIKMKDNVTGAIYDLRTGNSYTVSLPAIAQAAPARFTVLFSYPMLVQPESASCSSCNDGKITILKSGETNWQYSIKDNLGNMISSGSSSSSAVSVSGFASGTYSVSVDNNYTCTESVQTSVGPFTFYSRASGNWNDALTWSSFGCGGAASSISPGMNDNVVICSGNSVTINAASSCGNITINNGSLVCSNTFSVTGNFTLNSGTFNSGSQTVVLNGRRKQTISGLSTTFYNLTINNSTPAEAIQLNTSVTVDGTLSLKDGHIMTSSSNILICSASASVALQATPQDSSFIKGPMSHVVNVSTGVTKIFPVGEGISYRRFDLAVDQKTAATTTYTAHLENSSAAALGYSLPMTISNVSFVRYHVVTQSPSSTRIDNAQARIYFSCAGIDDQVQVLPAISVAKDNGASAWVDLNDTPNGYLCGGGSNWGSALSGTFTSFTGTKFTLTNTGSPDPMPVSLVQFQGERSGHDVNLLWSTSSEANNDFFTIERSAGQNENDGWIAIGTVKGAGNSNTELNYQFTDRPETINLKNPTLYYRLKQTDFNGISRYGNVVAIRMENTGSFSVFPNPSNGSFSINIIGEKEEDIHVRISDLSSREIYSESFTLQNEQEVHQVELPSMLSKGLYLVSVTGKSSGQLKKIVIQ